VSQSKKEEENFSSFRKENEEARGGCFRGRAVCLVEQEGGRKGEVPPAFQISNKKRQQDFGKQWA